MKKTLLLILIVAFSMIACVKPESLIGHYTGEGKTTMNVYPNGQVSLDGVITTAQYGANGTLTPWDLGTVNGLGKYDAEMTWEENGGMSVQMMQMATSKSAKAKFNFALDGSRVTCEVEINGKKHKFKK